MPRVLTGVGGVLSAAHRDADGLHGHSWEITAWFDHEPDALAARDLLSFAIARLDHSELPANLARGEYLAAWFGAECNAFAVDVARPLERIYARWERES